MISEDAFPSAKSFHRRVWTFAVRDSLLFLHIGALTGGTLGTALLGFIYWWFAAHRLTLESVGFAAAAISLMNLLAAIGEFGLGPYLLGEIPKNSSGRARLIATSLIFASLFSGLLSTGFVILAKHSSIGLGPIFSSLSGQALFIAGVIGTAVALVVDQALIGSNYNMSQMWRTLGFSALKLSFLAGLVFLAGKKVDATFILASWVCAQVISLCFTTLYIFSFHKTNRVWPQIALMRSAARTVFSHHVLNVVLQAPTLSLPFIVVQVLSPQTSAAFYAAWTLINVVLLVPASTATIAYATGATGLSGFRRKFRISFFSSVAFCVASSLIFVCYSAQILAIFNTQYPEIATSSFQVLSLAMVFIACKYFFVSIERLNGEMIMASYKIAFGCGLELTASILGANLDGLVGLSIGWLCAAAMETLIYLPPILKVIAEGVSYPKGVEELPATI